ncbi:hypothetical protein [Nocardia sp. NPDC047654]|uniref:hypothetical protein n=1 Tax=Nocardia sp. NPDC047654 TaxID=3364314 RepID=UPI0037172C82
MYLLEVRTPASGLQAEKVTNRLESFGPSDQAPIVHAAWPADLELDKFSRIAPTEYGFIVRIESRIVGFDLDSLTVAWRVEDGQTYNDQYNGISFAREVGVSSGRLIVFHSTRDGAEIGRLDDFALASNLAVGTELLTADSGFFVEHYKDLDYSLHYFDAVHGQLVGPIAPREDSFQRYGDLLLSYGWGDAGGKNSYLKVYDLRRRMFILEKTDADAIGLGFTKVFIAGNYLYLLNADDSPVIDLTTGAKVSSGWTHRPVDTIAGAWTLVATGDSAKSFATCFTGDNKYFCGNNATVQHSPDGVYTGRWY